LNVDRWINQPTVLEPSLVVKLTGAASTSPLSSSAKAGDPVRRGFSIQALTSLEYRIARLNRATASEFVSSLAFQPKPRGYSPHCRAIVAS